jgi:hypothetical protein
MASTSEIKVAPTTCILYKLPPEIREMVFIQAAFHFFEEQPKYRELRYHPDYESSNWMRLLEADARPTKGDLKDNRIPDFERALFGDKLLYIECLEARLSISTLLLFPSAPKSYKTRDEGVVTYPVFGQDIPFRLLDSIRYIRYQTW